MSKHFDLKILLPGDLSKSMKIFLQKWQGSHFYKIHDLIDDSVECRRLKIGNKGLHIDLLRIFSNPYLG